MEPPPIEGQHIGSYRILREIGRGGMGVVYKAEDESLGRVVALKVLSDELSHDDEFVERFRREAKSAASLDHRNIVGIYTLGKDEERGLHFIAMEYARGWPLDVMIKHRKRLSLRRAVAVTRQVAAALAEAHNHNIIHRDIKPNNILVKKDGSVKVLDFGLAKALDGSADLTAEHMQLGTPAYMSPDQCAGDRPTLKSDVYSLGVVLYEMLTGQKPYTADTPIAMMRKIANDPFPDVRLLNPDVPESLANLINRMTAKDANERPDAAQIYHRLKKTPQKEPGAEAPAHTDNHRATGGEAENTPVYDRDAIPTFASGGLTPDRVEQAGEGQFSLQFDYDFSTPASRGYGNQSKSATPVPESGRRSYAVYLLGAALFVFGVAVALFATVWMRGPAPTDAATPTQAHAAPDSAAGEPAAAPAPDPAEPKIVRTQNIVVRPARALELLDRAIAMITDNRELAITRGQSVEGRDVDIYALELPHMDKIALGIGDTVERVNGAPIHGYDSMLEALETARNRFVRGAADTVELLIARVNSTDYWLVRYRFQEVPPSD